MQKIIVLLSSMFLLVGCIESIALLGNAAGGATSSKIVQSSLKSAVSFGVKKKTGKTPLRHALAYAEKKNPNKKKEKCISFIDKTNSETCAIINKQIALTQDAVVKKISSTQNTVVKKISSTQNTVVKKISSTQNTVVKKISSTQDFIKKKQVVLEKTVEVKKEADYSINPKKAAAEFVSVVRAKIKEYDIRWLNRIEKTQAK
jgi:hypothetical protein